MTAPTTNSATATAPAAQQPPRAAPLDLFERERRRLRLLAYRLLGSVADADDVLQDCYIRWHALDHAEVRAPEALLTSMVTRLAIDHLRSARVRREFYVGEWLPEPLVEPWTTDADGALETEGDLSVAFLLLLERLPPDQRAVYVLRESLDLGFDAIGETLGKSAMACRQAYKRARERIGGPPRYTADRDRSLGIARAFLNAVDGGRYGELVALLTDDTLMVGDGGGKVRAALNPIRGADRVARFLIGVLGKADRSLRLMDRAVNGLPGFVMTVDGRFYGLLALDIRDGRVAAVYHTVNPDKLAHLDPALTGPMAL